MLLQRMVGFQMLSLVFQAKKSTFDNHGQMDYKNFSKWFKEQLLPNISANSIIFMDNAKYHNLYVEDVFPTPKTLKVFLPKWLKSNRPSEYHDDMLKPELYQKCKALCPKPKYILDVIAEEQGHTIIRTPQYHPELQPLFLPTIKLMVPNSLRETALSPLSPLIVISLNISCMCELCVCVC